MDRHKTIINHLGGGITLLQCLLFYINMTWERPQCIPHATGGFHAL